MPQPARLTTPCVWSPNRWLEQINVEPGAPAHGAGAALQARLRLGGEHAPHSRRAPPSHKLPSCKVAQLNACTALVLVNRRSYGGRSVTHAKISVLIAGTRWIVVNDRPLMRRIVNITHPTVVGRQLRSLNYLGLRLITLVSLVLSKTYRDVRKLIICLLYGRLGSVGLNYA